MDCATCKFKDCNDAIRWQCDEDVYTKKCPELFVKEEAVKFMIWKRYKQCGLPYAGGWDEQPAVMMDIIWACEDENDKLMRPTDGES